MTEKLTDQLSWEEFLKQSQKDIEITEVKPFNRLIAHSKNYFLISGYGAFTDGYVIVITKDFIPAFGLIDEENSEELNFIIKLLKENIEKSFNRKSVVFEHGMCACIGGLDRAHLHIMSIHKSSTEENLIKAINKTLYNRKAGIKYIKFKDYKLENIHDINHFVKISENKKSSDFKIVGNLLKIEDIKDLEEQKWPKITMPHINKGGHYVFFKSDFTNASFLTTHNFQTKFGRKVVFENEKYIDNIFKDENIKIQKKNEFLEPWKWQNYKFEANILNTMKVTKLFLKGLRKKHQKEYEKFEIKLI